MMKLRFSHTFKILVPVLSLMTSANAQLVMPSTATLKAYPIGTLEAITKRLIVCDDLIHRNWGYPDGVSALLCDDAMTACVRLGVYRFAAEAIKKGDLPGEQLDTDPKDQQFVNTEVQVKLHACHVALLIATGNAGRSVGRDVLKAAGLSKK